MSVRAFKYYTIQAGGTPQPLVGTYLTAAVSANTVSHSISWDQNISQPVTLTVADSSMFLRGDWADVIDPSTYATERCQVAEVTDSTHIKVTGLKNGHPGGAYGTGAWVALGAFAQNVYVQELDGNTGDLYVGSGPQMSTSSGALVIKKLSKVTAGTQGSDFRTLNEGGADTETLSQYWIDGTTSDSYLPSIQVV